MKNKLISVYNKIRNVRRIRRVKRYLRLNNSFTVIHKNAPTFLIDIKNPGALIALHFVIFRLAEERYNIVVSFGTDILNIYNPFLYRWQNLNCLRFVSRDELMKMRQLDNHYLISDHEARGNNAKGSFYLKGHEVNSELPILPYTLHSLQIFSGKLFFLDDLRLNSRENRIVFSGNYDENFYRKSFSKYPEIIDRFTVLTYLECELEEHLEHDASSLEKLNHKILWLKWSSKNREYKSRIDEHKWLKFLSKSDFFLALPGVHMPMSHNIIESMSVGTIPITQYHDHFTPALEDGKNCIVYRDLDDLKTRIEELFEMPEEKIAQMRAEVIQYFEENIDPKSLIEKIIKGEISEAQYHNEY